MPIPKLEICTLYDKYVAILLEDLSHLSNVTISVKSLTSATHSVLIVPGNCYANEGEQGIAGFILKYLVNYGDSGKPDIIYIVKEIIDLKYGGYLPIGNSILVPIEHHKYTHIVYMPLREDPKTLASLDNVYNALRSALYLLQENNIMEASMPMLNFINAEQQSEIINKIKEALTIKIFQ